MINGQKITLLNMCGPCGRPCPTFYLWLHHPRPLLALAAARASLSAVHPLRSVPNPVRRVARWCLQGEVGEGTLELSMFFFWCMFCVVLFFFSPGQVILMIVRFRAGDSSTVHESACFGTVHKFTLPCFVPLSLSLSLVYNEITMHFLLLDIPMFPSLHD